MRSASRQSIIKIKPYRSPPIILPTPSRESRFVRVTTVINLFSSFTLAAAALLFGALYNARENDREERKLQIEQVQNANAARQQCAEVQISMKGWARDIKTAPQGIAVMQTISYYQAACDAAGFPLASAQVEEINRVVSALKIKNFATDVDRFVRWTREPRPEIDPADAREALTVARQATVEATPTENLKLSQPFRDLERFIVGASMAESNRSAAIGYGVRWKSPFGPLRLDVSESLADPDGNRSEPREIGRASCRERV